MSEEKKKTLEKYSNEWMLNFAENCEANNNGECEAYWEACNLQCITESKEYKKHLKKFLEESTKKG